MEQRKIIHIDMDAFFAQVEQRNNPAYRGKPVIVGGDPRSRGVVSTCSYEARKFGVHSAMPTSQAYRICPQGIFVRGDYASYVEVSHQIREVFLRYSPLVEPLSLDEAFIDVTHPHLGPPSATLIAEEIRREIFHKTHLTCSAGVSYNKFLAKIASDLNKPNGIAIIKPDQAAEFLRTLPVKKFFGVGKVTQERMEQHGIFTGGDLLCFSREQLVVLFGKSGNAFYDYARGEDLRPVVPNRERKSIGKERTFAQDLVHLEEMKQVLYSLSVEVSQYAQRKDKQGLTVTLKVKYSDFKSVTRSQTLKDRTNQAEIIYYTILDLLEKTDTQSRSVRLLGVTIHNFGDDEDDSREPVQLIIPGFELF